MGEYLVLEGEESSVVAQVVEERYVKTPGLQEDLIRMGLASGNDGEVDSEVGRATRYLVDSKVVICVARGGLVDGSFTHVPPSIPDRSSTSVEKRSVAELLAKFQPSSFGYVDMGFDPRGVPVRVPVESLDGSLTVITGMKGSGKSHLSKILFSDLVKRGAPCLVLDLNGEYTGLTVEEDLSEVVNAPKIDVYRPGENLHFAPRIIGRDTIRGIFTKILGLPGVSCNVFSEVWDLVSQAGDVTLESLIKGTKRVVNNSMVRDALVARLMTLRSCRFVSDIEEGTAVEDMLERGRGSVVVLKNLSPTERRILVEILLSTLRRELVHERISPFFLFAEEAHMYVRDTYWEDIVTRMRHFGMFVVFITNQPDALEPQIYRQMDNSFIFRFRNEQDIEYLARTASIDSMSLKTLVSNLPTGTCLSIGEASCGLPVPINVRQLELDAQGGTRNVFKKVEDGSREVRASPISLRLRGPSSESP